MTGTEDESRKGVEVCRILGWDMYRFLTFIRKRLKRLKTDMIIILVVPVTSRMTLGGQPQPPFVVI